MHYNVSPLNFQKRCDGRGTAFRVTHTLSCIIGGLVIACHKKIREELLYLYRRTFTSAYVRAEPLIHQGCTRSEQEIRQGSDKDKYTWGDLMIRGLWDRQVGAIIDIKLGDTDADTYKYEPMTALLSRWERSRKTRTVSTSHNQQKN